MQLLSGDVSDQHALTRCAHDPGDVRVHGEAAKESVQRPVLIVGVEGSAGAGDQMKALRAIAALLAKKAFIADVTGAVLPDSRQGNAGLRGESLNDGLQHALNIALGCYGNGETE